MSKSNPVILSLILMLCGFTSCGLIYEYPDPCPDNALTIVNDWNMAPDADPDGMAYIFYEDASDEQWRFDFPGMEAGKVTLDAGRFAFVSLNDDTFRTVIRGETYRQLKAYTLPVKLPVDIEGSEKSVEAPDMLWGCSYREVELTDRGLRYIPADDSGTDVESVMSPENILTVLQRQITPHYRLIIEDVSNLSGVASMSAALTGMAECYRFSDGYRGENPVILAFDVGKCGESAIEGQFCTFGIPEHPDAPNIVYLFVTLTDGRDFIYRFDVTKQVREAPDPMSVIIRLRGLELEKTEQSGGSFDVEVDGWTTVDVNITD